MAKNDGYWEVKLYGLATKESASNKSFVNLYKKIKQMEESWSRKTVSICLKYDENREITLNDTDIAALNELFGTNKFNMRISWNDSFLEFCIMFTDVKFPNF